MPFSSPSSLLLSIIATKAVLFHPPVLVLGEAAALQLFARSCGIPELGDGLQHVAGSGVCVCEVEEKMCMIMCMRRMGWMSNKGSQLHYKNEINL